MSHTYFVYELTACVTSRHTGFSLGEVRGRDHLEDLGVDGSIILKCIFKKWVGVVDWIALTQDLYRWRALVNTVMNLRVT
jgi:hypothetical protein